ncbi:MAG TPA: hypothetical protein VFL62_12705 [Bradyrhizobium sp.]|uniref:hypothetical protein n=1 Tax=Bradyrhizobium sp. TaxID=376 RepID=UPI002D7E906E|nr:hypothetical protein [Bradyrhizobium sp.]HET7887080.1 hypothetical protein [Bradyrhizobium sp.]
MSAQMGKLVLQAILRSARAMITTRHKPNRDGDPALAVAALAASPLTGAMV